MRRLSYKDYPRRIVVIGGDYAAFIDWCRENCVPLHKARYIGEDWIKLQGFELKADDVVRLGGTTIEIEQMLATRIR